MNISLSRSTLLVIILFIPICFGLVVPRDLGINGIELGIFLLSLVGYSWHLWVLNIIRKNIDLNVGVMLFVSICLLIIPAMFALDVATGNVKETLANSTVLTWGVTSSIVLGLIAYSTLANSLGRLMQSKGKKMQFQTLFVPVVYFPIGIWMYHEDIRTWNK
jgi:hypothetical protein